MDNYENLPEYHYFTNRYSSNDLLNNRFYKNFEPFPIDNKENRLTIPEMMRIVQGLQILKNFLQRFYPNHVVIQQISWLNYLCFTRKSIQPLSDFYKKYNLRHLWRL